MQECETSTGKQTPTKRVSVRSGGAGHAHSGIIKTDAPRRVNGSKNPKAAQSKIVKLGR
jgi:hypothetical protein